MCGTAPFLTQQAFGQTAAPFQMLSSDLEKYAKGAPVPGPFQVNQTDVQAATEYSTGQTASGTLTQNTGDTVVFSGTGSADTADIINNSGGATRFYDNSTAAGADITNNGALQFSDSASGGQAQIVTNSGAATVFTDNAVAGSGAPGATLTNNGTTIFLDQSGTGNSAIVNNQSGELHLAGNSAIGGAFDNSGLVVASDNANLGTGFVVNNATGNTLLRQNASLGSATLANSGTLVFTGNSSAATGTINNNQTGVAAFLGSSNAGIGSQIVNDGRLYFGESATAGQSIIRTQAGGQTVFYGSATGGTATLRVGNGGLLDISLLDTAGLSVGTLTSDAGSVVALGSKTLTVGSTNQPMVVAGLQDGGLGGGTGGALVKVGTGELELTGTNSYTGVTRVEAGRLKAAAAGAFAPLSDVVLSAGTELDIGTWDQTIGSLAGAGSVILGNVPNRLTIGANNQSSVFAGDFRADGGIVKVGTGTLTLTGTSTSTGYSRVDAGTLRVDGSLAQSPLTVAGGTLAGSGTVGQTTVLAGGTITPGGGSNLTIASDLLLDAGAVYRVDITPTRSDSLTVANNANLGGATLALGTLSTTDPTGSYVILSAANITGAFAFDPYDYAFLVPDLDQSATAVTLTIARNGLTFSNIALTENQRAAAVALEGFDPADPVFAALLTANAADARQFYELASGEAHAAATLVSQQAFSIFSGSLRPSRPASLGGIIEHRSAGTAVGSALDVGVTAPMATQGGWIAPLGSVGSLAGDGNGAALNWTAGGLASGYEVSSATATGHTVVGFGVGTITSRASMDQRLSTIAMQGYYAGLYGQWRDGPLWIDGQIAHGANHVSTTRSMEIGGVSRTATADYWSQTVGAGLEARYEFELANNLFVGPVGTLDIAWAGHGGAVESGAGSLNQTIAPSDSWKLDTGIGVAARYEMPLDDGANVSVVGKALWQHSFGDSVATQNVSLAGGGGSFIVSGADPGRDRLRLVAGVEYQPSPDVIVSLDYAATIGGPELSHAARLALRVSF